MKIQLLSDLHLEVDPSFVPVPALDAEVLVLAGDIGAASDTPMAQHGAADWCLTRFAPGLRHWPVPVLYLPGNHEYDGQDFDACRAELRDLVEALGMHWLERDSVVLRDTRFIGTTLWSDYDCFADQPSYVPGSMTHNLRIREKCFRAANFYLEKAATYRDGRLFDAQAMRDEALICQRWLRAALAEPFMGKTVVVTHFAPSLKSHDPRYGLTPGTAGFCNALDDLVPNADLWLHGHLHCPSDYRIGRCRVVANPLGYAEQDEQKLFAPALVIEP
ncbi:MAG: metallophosphoesterase [Gammaproteobacteria bacterium]|nr:metallophosphoesterase [Gammaproteobacteria bacterium]